MRNRKETAMKACSKVAAPLRTPLVLLLFLSSPDLVARTQEDAGAEKAAESRETDDAALKALGQIKKFKNVVYLSLFRRILKLPVERNSKIILLSLRIIMNW